MRFIIFGTGSYYRNRKRKYLSMDIACFLDNDINKKGEILDGHIIDVPTNINKYQFDYIIIASVFFEEMRQQLLDLGVPTDRIIDKQHLAFFKNLNHIEQYHFKSIGAGKKILLISHVINVSGAPTVLFRIAKILKNNGYNVTIATSSEGNDGALLYEIVKNEISVDIYDDLEMLDIETLCDTFDMVFVNTVVLHPIIQKLSGKNIPVIWWLHEEQDVYETYGITKEDVTVKSNIHVYAVGWRAREVYEKIACSAINELLYGIPALRKIQHINNKKVIFAIVGEFSKRKGQALLCDVVKKYEEQWNDQAEFWIVGYIKEKEKEKYKDYKCVKCFGLVTQETLEEIYKQLDVLVCPSENDPMPASVTDALMREKTCIVSNMTGQAKFIKPYENGLICKVNDEESLSSCIQWILDHRDRLDSIGKNGYKIYEQYFTMEEFEKQILKIVKALV